MPNLARYNDVADFIFAKGGGYSSESEADDLPDSKIVLPDDFQDKKKNTTVALKTGKTREQMGDTYAKGGNEKQAS